MPVDDLRSMPNGSAQPLRVLMVTHFFPAHGGGLERVALELVNCFATVGVQVVWMSSNTNPAPAAVLGVRCVSVRTTNFIERRTQLPYPLWALSSLVALWRESAGADVVHVHEHLYWSSLTAVLIAKLRGRPVVITQHMGELQLRSRLATCLYKFGARTLGWWQFGVADRSVFISANVRRFFGREHASNSPLIYNGVDITRFTAVSERERVQLRAALRLPEDRRVMLFVGRFVRKKGLQVIQKLARRFPEVYWVLIGSGPEAPDASLPNVRLTGLVEHDGLPAYYRAADLLILPSSGEGFPLVVQEAMCCGTGVLSTPEVASACPEATELIRQGPLSNSVDEWETTLRAALADELYLGARVHRAQRARALWSWDRCANEYLAMFRGLGRQ